MRKRSALVLATLAVVLLAVPPPGSAEEASAKAFESPEAAVEAMRVALDANDDAALRALTGPDSEDIVQSGTDPAVKEARRRVAALAKHGVEFDTLDDGTMVVILGATKWPLPIPLVKAADGWRFDAKQARDEILARRIGTNELRVMKVMDAIVEAQKVYRATDRDGDGVLEYAKKFVSTDGQRDGLWWPREAAETPATRAPLGAVLGDVDVAAARAAGGLFSGYRWKLLTERGPSGRGGAASYLNGDNLVNGFAVLAVPAEHRKSGVMSFMVSHRGVVFEKDLGAGGGDAFPTIVAFDPDASWKPAGEEESAPATPAGGAPPTGGVTPGPCAPPPRR